MKKMILILFFTILFSAGLLLSSMGADDTAGAADGHDWANWSKETKEVYVYGLVDGLNMVAIFFNTGSKEDLDAEETVQKLEEEGKLTSKDDLMIPEFIASLNKYYKDYDLDDPVIKALLEEETTDQLQN